MSLVESYPDGVRDVLRDHGVAGEDFVIALESDIGPDGQFGRQWLMATPERLFVVQQENGVPEVARQLPLGDVNRAAAESMVGAGVFRVTTNGEPEELLRYSNAKGKQFGKAARKLQEIVTEGKEPFHDDDEEQSTCPSCSRPLPPDTKVCPQCINRRKTLARLFSYMMPYWKLFLVTLILGGLAMGSELARPLIMEALIDWVFTEQRPPQASSLMLGFLGALGGTNLMSQQGQHPELFVPLLLVLLGLALLGLVNGLILSRITPWLAQILTRNIRQELYEAFQRLGLKFFDKKNVGSLMTRVTQDTQSLNNLLSDALPEAFWMIGTFVIITTILLIKDWQLALIGMIPGPLVMVVAGWFFKRLMPNFRRMWSRWSRLGSVVNDSLSGIRVVKAFAQEGREIDRFSTRNDDLFQTGVTIERYFWVMMPTIGFIIGAGTLLVWYVGGGKILAGRISLGELMAFTMYLGQILPAFRWIGRLNQWITRSLTACERIFEVLDTTPEVYESDETVSVPNIEGHVKFDDVTFGYDPNKPVLKNINIDVKPGEMIGLVGPSGAGKSTTVSLICRFYAAQQGTLSIDGVDIRKISLHDLRRQIGIVLQEPFLFSGTIAENIAYAKPEATLEEIMDAAKAANAHEFIVKFPDGYDTQVGERGGRLSGGERQRVSIARAILHDPRILILDEATASVDTETEKKIQDALARLVQGRTTFAIAHRLSTLRNADRLLVLERGEQRELGTHDELLEADGLYSRLVKMQSEINEIRAVDG
ncbi:MAG: ATP-binding cassette domain-containing protein [Armatimonadia bacterium]|nr:ATP-binding cassette domain-containing protein [Armatimonadia bacterium]